MRLRRRQALSTRLDRRMSRASVLQSTEDAPFRSMVTDRMVVLWRALAG
jgi:hypothetical protein